MKFDKAVNEFLEAQKKSTRFTYTSYLKQYLEFTKKSGSQLLQAKKQAKEGTIENSMFGFKTWLLDKGYSETYAKACVGAIRGFYAYHRVPLVFRRTESKKLGEASRKTEDYLFDREDLGRMALTANLKERFILLGGKSLGLRVSDFVALTFGKFRSLKLDEEAPISIGEVQTQKERVRAYPFLDSDAIPIVKAILEANKDKADTDRILTDTPENLSVILQNLAKKAGINTHGKRIRLHCLRKYLIDRLSAYASESQWRQLIGKQVEEKAYVSTEQLRQIYKRAMKDIVINNNGGKTRKLIELENALVESQRRITALETTNEILRNKLAELENNTMKKFVTIDDRLTTLEIKTKIRKELQEFH